MPSLGPVWIEEDLTVYDPDPDNIVGFRIWESAKDEVLKTLRDYLENAGVNERSYVNALENLRVQQEAWTKLVKARNGTDAAKLAEAEKGMLVALGVDTDRLMYDLRSYIDYYAFDRTNDIAQHERALRNVRLQIESVNTIIDRDLPNLLKAEEPVAPAGDCRCNACRYKESTFSERRKAKRKEVKYHGYNPGWTFRTTRNDNGNYFLGVELETDRHCIRNGVREDSSISDEVVSALALPEDFWEPTHDSSISGVEFVSHPATIAYWKSIRPHLARMFKGLVHAGYRSHDNDNCGMHVSISDQAFTGINHLARFLWLLHEDPEWSTAMSQRTKESANDWAAFRIVDWDDARSWAEQYRNGDEPYSRYSVLNNPGGGRYEFRLPRGTLRLDRFYKNLEWTVSMVEFTKGIRKEQANPVDYTDWLKNQRYHDLNKFMAERGLMEVD